MMGNDRPIDLDNLEFRELRGEEELPGLARLYDIAGWGPVDPDTLGRWFLGPREAGVSLIMVIAEPGRSEVLGMTIFQPYRAWLGDHVGTVVRSRAAVLDPRLRRRGRGVTAVDENDPLKRLMDAAWDLMRSRDWHITIGLPNPKMVARSELATYERRRFGSTATYGNGRFVDLTNDEPTGGTLEISLRSPESEIGSEYDQLWSTALRNLPIEFTVMRDAQGVRTRGRRGLRLEARRPGSDQLVGYGYFGSFNSYKLDDLLAVDRDAMTDTILSITAWMRRNRDAHSLAGFEAIPHPWHLEGLDSLHPEIVDWKYGMFVSSRHDGPVADPTRWYVTAGD